MHAASGGKLNKGVEIYGDLGLGINFIDYSYGRCHNDYDRCGIYFGAGVEFPVERFKPGLDFKYQVLFSNPVDSDIANFLIRFGF